jgi:hypothetical protein
MSKNGAISLKYVFDGFEKRLKDSRKPQMKQYSKERIFFNILGVFNSNHDFGGLLCRGTVTSLGDSAVLTGSGRLSCSGDAGSVSHALKILWHSERLPKLQHISRKMTSAEETPLACTPDDAQAKQASTALPPHSGAATQRKFVTPTSKSAASPEKTCLRTAASSTRVNLNPYRTPLNIGKPAGTNKPQSSAQDSFAISPAQSPLRVRQSASPLASNFMHLSSKPAKTAEKHRAQSSPKRNAKEWNQDQTIALLTEIVEGETYIMVKGKKKYEERTLVSRAKGIPHGKTTAFWDAIITKLQSSHWNVMVGGKSQPLFPLALNKDYVSGHFDKLVNNRLAQKERRRASAGSRTFGVKDDDFETGEGDDSQVEEGLGEADSDGRSKKVISKRVQIEELLDAYLIQQLAYNKEVEAALFVVADDQNADRPKAGSKRKSGQESEHLDNQLIESTANGDKKKKEKQQKLSMPTHVERSQAQSLEHATKMSSGFQALADSQKPCSVEEFTKKSGALVEQIGKTVAETATQAINAWSKYKSSARACVSEDGLHEWLTLREEPLRMVCKRCGNVIG